MHQVQVMIPPQTRGDLADRPRVELKVLDMSKPGQGHMAGEDKMPIGGAGEGVERVI